MAFSGKKYDVDPRLSQVLRHFYVIEVPEDTPPEAHYLSPSLEMMIVFNFGPPVVFSFGEEAGHTIERVGVLGPLRQMMRYELRGGSHLLILPFIYNGFSRFVPLPLERIDQLTAAEEQTYYEPLEVLWAQLLPLTTSEKRTSWLTDHLVRHLRRNDPAATPFMESVPEMHDRRVNPARAIADKAALSERSIQLKLKKHTGYSFKEQARFLRFKEVLYYVLGQPPASIEWLDVVVAYGYHDQSHLIKDFQYYTGSSPRQFVQLNQAENFCMSVEPGPYGAEGPGA